jgi:hypothetical protein
MAIFLAFKGTRKCPELYFTVDQILGGGSRQKMYIKKTDPSDKQTDQF